MSMSNQIETWDALYSPVSFDVWFGRCLLWFMSDSWAGVGTWRRFIDLDILSPRVCILGNGLTGWWYAWPLESARKASKCWFATCVWWLEMESGLRNWWRVLEFGGGSWRPISIVLGGNVVDNYRVRKSSTGSKYEQQMTWWLLKSWSINKMEFCKAISG